MSAPGAKAAVGAALVDAVDAARGGDAEQLDLIGIPGTFSPERGAGVRVAASLARRGRPAGSQNLATREVKAFCRKVFGWDPLIEGFRWVQHTPETLAAVLGCTRLEAFDRLEKLRAELARYFYAPMQPVDEQGRPVPTFSLTIGAVSSSAPGAAPPWQYAGGPVVEHVENQGVSDAPALQSHEPKSHEPPK